MKETRWVSTLIAPQGMALYQTSIEAVCDQLIRAGAVIEQTLWLEHGQAADIYHTQGHTTLPETSFDVLTQPFANRRKKILIADMESTIIEQEMLDELAARIGIGEQVASITRRAMNGELDFEAALHERVHLLKGQSESLLQEVAQDMTFMPGAPSLVAAMKRAGGKCWLVSGGFTFFVKEIAERLGFDCYYANELKVENGIMTGEVAQPILGKEAKKDLLEKACATYGYKLSQSLAVGDGANDVAMLQACNAQGGLGVAYHAKPTVREIIPNQINHGDLSALIYAQNLIP